MTVKRLIGSAPSQVSRNRDLGTMAFQDANQYYSLNTQPTFRNRIINGDMRIDQRNAGSLISVANTNTFTVDRWTFYGLNAAGVVSAQQVTDAPVGFNYSLKIITTTADTTTTTTNTTREYFIRQSIEGYNIADFNWGTANAKPATLSFWVKGSTAGLYGVCLRNNANDAGFQAYYMINATNTWEYKTITIPAPTSGTFESTNSRGVQFIWSYGSGTAAQGTPTPGWNTIAATGVIGQTNLIGTVGSSLQLTGVQLEKGTVASAFEFRPYSIEFDLCQRYYQKHVYDAWMRAHGPGGGNPTVWHSANDYTFSTSCTLPVPMRAQATTSVSLGSAAYLYKRIVSATGTATTEQSGTAASIGIDTYAGYPTAAYINIQAANMYAPGSQMNLSLGGNYGPISYIFNAEL